METTNFSKETEKKKHSLKNIIFIIISVLYLIFLIYTTIYWIWLQTQQIKPMNVQEKFDNLFLISILTGIFILFALSMFYTSGTSLGARRSCGTHT